MVDIVIMYSNFYNIDHFGPRDTNGITLISITLFVNRAIIIIWLSLLMKTEGGFFKNMFRTENANSGVAKVSVVILVLIGLYISVLIYYFSNNRLLS